MSEESIASLSLRPDPGASLPPRKRLLAGFKQNGWSSFSSSSSSSSLSILQEIQVKSSLLPDEFSLGKAESELVDLSMEKKSRTLGELQTKSSPFHECSMENRKSENDKLDMEDSAGKFNDLVMEKRKSIPDNLTVRNQEAFCEPKAMEEREMPDDMVARNWEKFDEMLRMEKRETFLFESTVSDNYRSQQKKYKCQNFSSPTERCVRKVKESVMDDVKDSLAQKNLEEKPSSLNCVITPMRINNRVVNVKKMNKRVLGDVKQVFSADMDLQEMTSPHQRSSSIISPKKLKKNAENDVKFWPEEEVSSLIRPYKKVKKTFVNDIKVSPAEKRYQQETPSKHQILGSPIEPVRKTKKSVLDDIRTLSAGMDLKENPSNLSSSTCYVKKVKKVKRGVQNEVKNSPADEDVKENPLNPRIKKVKVSIVNDAHVSPAEKNLKENLNLQEYPLSDRNKEVYVDVNEVKVLPAETVLKENLELQDNHSSPINNEVKENVMNDAKDSPGKIDHKHAKYSLVKDEAITVEEAIASVKPHGRTDNAGCLKPRGRAKQEKSVTDESMSLENIYDKAFNPRRNPSRQNHSKATNLLKKQAQLHKSSHTMASLSDEELARQLHRAMNSSPRISRCVSHDLKLSLL